MGERDEVVGEPILKQRIPADQAAAVELDVQRMHTGLKVFGDQNANVDLCIAHMLVSYLVDVEAGETSFRRGAGYVCHGCWYQILTSLEQDLFASSIRSQGQRWPSLMCLSQYTGRIKPRHRNRSQLIVSCSRDYELVSAF